MKFESYIANARQLLCELQKAKRGSSPVGRGAFAQFSDRYNNVVADVNKACGCGLQPRNVQAADLSFSGMFARPESVDALEAAAQELLAFLEKAGSCGHGDAFHCFKIDSPCPKEIRKDRFKFFIATSFSPEYKAITDLFMDKVSDEFGISQEMIFRADNYLATRDIMCKVCQGLRESECVVVNISGFNPNVMLELGMALGLCKKVILLKDSRVADQEVSDIKGLEYVAYSDDDEWYERMRCIMKGKRLI